MFEELFSRAAGGARPRCEEWQQRGWNGGGRRGPFDDRVLVFVAKALGSRPNTRDETAAREQEEREEEQTETERERKKPNATRATTRHSHGRKVYDDDDDCDAADK